LIVEVKVDRRAIALHHGSHEDIAGAVRAITAYHRAERIGAVEQSRSGSRERLAQIDPRDVLRRSCYRLQGDLHAGRGSQHWSNSDVVLGNVVADL